MQAKALTIAIPTYNRNEILKRNLGILLEQVTDRCRVVIWDNASAVPVLDTLAPLLASHPGKEVTVHRNRANIGANANIMRCLEFCDTPHVWVLGDDDAIRPDAVAVALAAVEEFPDACCINFFPEAPNHRPRGATTEYRGVDEFVEGIDNVGEYMHISSNIYHRERLADTISAGYFYQYTYAPHLAMLLKGLAAGGTCVSSHRSLTAISNTEVPRKNQASPVMIAMRLPLLLDLPLAPGTLKKLGEKIHNSNDGWLTDFEIFHQLLLYSHYAQKKRESLYYLHVVYQRFFSLKGSCAGTAKRCLYHLLLLTPSLSLAGLRALYRVAKGREHAGEAAMYNMNFH